MALSDEWVGHTQVRAQLFAAAKKKRLAHALLFAGPEGVGKKRLAKELAAFMLCSQHLADRACGTCPSCVQMNKNQHHAYKLLETEGSQFKIEEAREIIQSLSLRQWSGARFIVIDGADKLNPQAANALLKVIEEPPEETYFILITSRPQKILPTIRSRAQWVRFAPLSDEEVRRVTGLSGWVLASSGGSVQRALELSGSDRSETRLAAVRALASLAQSISYLDACEPLVAQFKDKSEVLGLLETWGQVLRDASVTPHKKPIHADVEKEWHVLKSYPLPQLDRMFGIVSQMRDDLEANVDRQILLESGVLKLQSCMQPGAAS